MITKDDRTTEQLDTHFVLIVGNDSFMSGWGGAEGGTSVAAWACRYDDQRLVLDWVERRGEMKYVRVVHDTDGKYRPRNAAHYHVYMVNENHPSVERKYAYRAECAERATT